MTNLIDATENARLDALTSYNSTILNHLTGEDLDKVAKRRGMRDSVLRAHVLEYTHPDDLFATLVGLGYSLASFGIDSVSL